MKLLLIIILFIQSLILAGQNTTLCLTYAPTDRGTGFRYDKQITDIGIYGSASRGSYRFNDGQRINNHIKLSSGVVKYFQNKSKNTCNLFSLGLSYHSYGKIKDESIPIHDHVFFPVSLDVGVGFIINHFNIGWCYDPIKKEVIVNSGFYFY